MKEEIEEEFYPGQHEGIQKGKLYRKRAFYTRSIERERLGKLIVSFFTVVRLVIYVDEETESSTGFIPKFRNSNRILNCE